MSKSSDIATCPMAPGTPPDREGLRCCHVSRGSRPAPLATTRQGRATVSPHVPQLQTRLPVREGSDVATCPVAPGPPPGREGLQCHHMSYDSIPASRCGRAMVPPHASWLSASEACPCIPKTSDIRLIMDSPSTQSKHRIKCIQDKSYAEYG
jgi:hypothetical protein